MRNRGGGWNNANGKKGVGQSMVTITGIPGDGNYREFHKKMMMRSGLPY